MEQDPIRTDGRAMRRERRLGADAACALCGVTTPAALTLVNRSLLEEHHAAARAHDGALTVPVCRNCHAILTEGQLRAGVSFAPEASAPERLAAALRALGAFLCDLGARLIEWADRLAAFVAALDRACPAWRALPEARA